MITLNAPAKINLTLEVLGVRPDGYHEIRSVFQTVDLYDTLRFGDSQDFSIACDMPGWSAEQSLVSKALRLMQDFTPAAKAKISIEKRIPLSSGLGGDSSDAAATLKGFNRLWKLNLTPDNLLALAARLGSDVPFFISGGAALAEGRGEILTPLPSMRKMWVVLFFPDIPISPGKTAKMYAGLKPSHFTDGSITQKLAEAVKKGRQFEPSLLFNTFENVAGDVFPGLSGYKEHLIKLGADHVHLAGSGPALFTIVAEKARAQDIYARCKDQGMRVSLAATV